MAETADIVIIGGGVMGVSAAYHLAERGYGRIVILEQAEVGSGSTGRSNGGLRHQFSDAVGVEMSRRTVAFVKSFKDRFGVELPFNHCGYLYIIKNEHQLATFRKNSTWQREMGIDVQVLTADETKKLFPYLNTDDILGGSYSPNDGEFDPVACIKGMAARVQEMGVTIRSGCQVLGINRTDGKVTGVTTSQGEISAPAVLIAAGAWSGEVGKLAGLDVPVVPRRREVYVTTPFPIEQIPETPYILDQVGGFGLRREGTGLSMGTTLPIPPTFDVSPNWEPAREVQAKVAARCPAVAGATIGTAWAGLLEVTPDHVGIISAVQAVGGLYLLAGFSGHGNMQAPIAGQLISEIIADGRASSLDISTFRFERFAEGDVQVDAMSPFGHH